MAINKKKDYEDKDEVQSEVTLDIIDGDELDEEPSVSENVVEVPEVPSARTPAPTTKSISATEAQALLRKYHDSQKEAQAALEGTKFRTVQIQLAQQLADTARAINDLG